MQTAARKFLFDLLDTPSPTGWETPGQKKWAAYNRKHSDRVENDAYGNAWASIDGSGGKKNKAPVVMLEAHADEIGFIVKHVTKEGFLHLDRIGGVDHGVARGRRVTILGEKGHVTGIIGNTAIHIRDRDEKPPLVHELHVDVGASNAEEVAKLGVRVGTPMVYSDSAQDFGKNRIVGRALDNRIGGFIIAEVMRELSGQKSKIKATTIAANCIHEEIGGLGSRMVAHRLNPDVCIVLDVTHATDTPTIKHVKHGEVKLGGGPTVTHGAANHRLVVDRLLNVAKKAKIPIQHEAASRFTGTDADGIYHTRDGIPTALVSLPLRYMHSIVEVADYTDIEQTVQLLAGFVNSVGTDDDFAIKI
ncbi:MAG: putative aminopeptidase FrvX [Verrucomicrobiales bacterium]|jgi:putative aminopeptidase FrvX